MSVSIRDVADKAGVSYATVSRALNNKDSIRTATKERIIRIAKKMKYSPNRAAQVLAGNKVTTGARLKNISIIFDRKTSMNDSYFSQIVRNIEKETVSFSDISISITSLSNQYKDFLDISKRLKDNLVGGIILFGNFSNETVALFEKHFKNCVLVDKPSQQISSIINDNKKGAFEAVSHLIKQGCRKIAFINGPERHYFSKAILEGYKEALGTNYDKKLCTKGDFHTESGYQAMKEIFARNYQPDGLFTNDEMAFGAMRAMKEEGLKIPEDISVIGFDNLYWSSHIDPPLSTVKVNYAYMARTAVRKIIENFNEDRIIHTTTTIPVELIIRKSTEAKGG